MTRTEERNLMYNILQYYPTKVEDGEKKYYDARYNMWFTEEETIKTFDLVYEILDEMGYETAAGLYLSGEVEDVANFSRELIERMYQNSLISEEVYNASISNMVIALAQA
jgi:hypothetical protein